jgi:hypothetical protein
MINDGDSSYIYQYATNQSNLLHPLGSFFKIKNATSQISDPVFSGIGLNDLTVSGVYIGDISKRYRVQIDSVNRQIGVPIFTGTGLNDLTVSGSYTGDISKSYRIEIDGVNSSADTFRWSDGSTWNVSTVTITGLSQPLSNGVNILFKNLTGHKVGDSWTIQVYISGSPDTFRWSDNDGVTWNSSNVTITALYQYLSDGVSISFRNTYGHTDNDLWIIDATIDSAFYPPLIPSSLHGHGIYPRQNTGQFYFSSINDFAEVNALDYYYLDGIITASLEVNDEIWFICRDNIKIWYDTKNSDNLFEQRSNMIINYGSESPYTIKKASNNVVFMLARNEEGGRVVVEISNYTATIVSDEPLIEELRTYTRVDDAFADVIERNGHLFYMITFPTANKTWVLDTSLPNKPWHQWCTTLDNELPSELPTVQGRFRGNCHVSVNGQNIFGDFITGKLFILSELSNLDYDKQIWRERTSQHLSDKNLFISINWMQIDVQSGVARQETQKNNPTIMLTVSRDGGETWGNEMILSIGKTGKYKNRCKTPPLGTARVFTFKIRATDPVYNVILGAIADIEEVE